MYPPLDSLGRIKPCEEQVLVIALGQPVRFVKVWITCEKVCIGSLVNTLCYWWSFHLSHDIIGCVLTCTGHRYSCMLKSFEEYVLGCKDYSQRKEIVGFSS